MSSRVVICCGSGGVGKTTSSAALALSSAINGSRVAVLTIDPAKRLADSLGIQSTGGAPQRIPLKDIEGSCHAVILDVEETFEGLIHKFSSSPESAAQILNNRYFQFASTRLGGVHEYMASEKVRELATSGDYDLVIVDTPPSRNALDFLRAPERVAGLMDGAVMRWMAMPASRGGWRALELGSEAVAKVLRLLIGQGTIGEIAGFFELFRELWDGFHSRSLEVQALLASEQTTFLLISSPAPSARREALFFLDQLKKMDLPFGGFLINRAEVQAAETGDLESQLNGIVPPEMAATIAKLPALQNQRAQQHQRSIDALLAAGPKQAKHWIVPDLGRPIHTLNDLIVLSEQLPQIEALSTQP